MDPEKPNESTTKKGLSGLVWNFSGSILQILSQFIIIGVLARLLTPEEFGVVGVILIVVNFSNIFTNLGLATAIIQLKDLTPQHVAQGYSLSLLIGLSLGILFYFFAPMVAVFFDLQGADNAIRFFALFFPITSVNSVTSAVLTRNLQFSLLVKCGLAGYILGSGVVAIVLALMGFGYWALILGQFAGLVINLLLMMYFRPPTFSFRYQKPIARDLLVFGSGHTLGTVFNYFAENTDNIIVGRSLGTVAMGIYSKSFQLYSIPATFFGKAYDTVFFPILSKNQDKKEKLASFYLLSTSLCFGVLFPLATLLFINADLVIQVLLGEQWGAAVYPFQILIFGLAYRFGTRINKSYLKSLGIIFRGAYYQFIFTVLMVICCLVGAYFYELPGIAYGVFVATFLNYAQMSFRLYKELQFPKGYFLGLHLKTLLFYCVFFVATLILYQLQIRSVWVHLSLSLAVYAPVMIWMVLHKKNIIFNTVNAPMLRQIFSSMPVSLQNNVKRIPSFRNYFS